LGTSYTSLFKKEKTLLESLEDMNDKLSLINRKIGARQQPGPKKRKVIEVIFDSEKDQQIDCRVSYITRNAGWTPVYKTDVPADLSGLNLTMFGIVSQKTGEDWDGVTLSLSNAAPMDSTELPKAATWKVDTPVYPVRAVDAATIGMAAGGAEPVAVEDFELSEDAPVAAAQPAEFRQASEKKLPMAFEYGFDKGIDLPSGEDDAYLPLFTKTIDGTFFVHAVPDTDTSAYLVCRTAPDQALLASRMNIHFDGRFVGATTLAEQQAGTDLLINLGPDRGVAVRKEKTSDKTAETFFGKVDRATVARQLSYVIVIENTKDTDTLVHIEDALPVSGTDRIQIKGLTLSPKPRVEDVDDREGVVRWELLIGAGQTKKIHIEFGIKYPKEMRPFGL
ncbi:MAG: DUF4139 domain-containing protein, partial [Desulfobacterales bacterium]|nr:DUF4139 domain-containing protein [Desulfobacterales bacterium]